MWYVDLTQHKYYDIECVLSLRYRMCSPWGIECVLSEVCYVDLTPLKPNYRTCAVSGAQILRLYGAQCAKRTHSIPQREHILAQILRL